MPQWSQSAVTDSCANCRFWKADPYSAGHKYTEPPYQGDPTEGQCRRYPPHMSEYQTTAADIWCGEHDPIEDQRE
jgi:hypothetical protein